MRADPLVGSNVNYLKLQTLALSRFTRVLFLDLDVVVAGDLSFLLAQPHELVGYRSCTAPVKEKAAQAVWALCDGHEENKRLGATAGAISVLVALLATGGDEAQMHAANALGASAGLDPLGPLGLLWVLPPPLACLHLVSLSAHPEVDGSAPPSVERRDRTAVGLLTLVLSAGSLAHYLADTRSQVCHRHATATQPPRNRRATAVQPP